MALTKETLSKAESTVLLPAQGSRRINVGISQRNASHIIDRLTELYTDPVTASVREIISNAVDATASIPEHLRKPVEIETPDDLNMVFVVRDYGTGMSEDDIENTVAFYGESIKSDDLNSIGHFGLGMKSPLAYTEYFDVSTTKDGITTNFTMSRSNGEVTIEIKSSERTGERSGTTVSIPVVNRQDLSRFANVVNANYKIYSHTTPFVIDGVLYNGSPEYVYISDIVVHEDEDDRVYGKLFFRKDAVEKYLGNARSRISYTSDIAYVLGGFAYSEYGAPSEIPMFSVEIVPALVNFGSSRDAITRDDKFASLKKLISKQIYQQGNAEKILSQVKDYNRFNSRRVALAISRDYQYNSDTRTLEGLGLLEGVHLPHEIFDSNLGFNIITAKQEAASFPGVVNFSAERAQKGKIWMTRIHASGATNYMESKTLSSGAAAGAFFKSAPIKMSVSSAIEPQYGSSRPVVLLTEATHDEIVLFGRQREIAFAKAPSAAVFLFTASKASEISKDDLALAKKLAPEDTFASLTLAAFLQKIEGDVKAARAERAAKAAEARKAVNKSAKVRACHLHLADIKGELTEKKAVYEGLLLNNYRSYSEIFAHDDSVLVFSANYRSDLIGLANIGVDITKRDVFLIKDVPTVALLKELASQKDRIYFSSGAKLASKFAVEFAEGRELTDCRELKSVVNAYTLADLLRAQLRYTTVSDEAMVSLAPHFRDTKYSEIFDAFVESAGNPAVYIIDPLEITASRFGDEITRNLTALVNAMDKVSNGEFGLFSIVANEVISEGRQAREDSEFDKSIIEEIAKRVKAQLNADEVAAATPTESEAAL